MFGLFNLTRRFRDGELLILCYHGFELEDESQFRPQLFMSREKFSRRISCIKRLGIDVVPLGEAVRNLREGRLAKNTIVLTIDDGFHSTYSVCAPMLEEAGYPASVYVTTYYVENQVPVFSLALQYAFWKTAKKVFDLEEVDWSRSRQIILEDNRAVDEVISECTKYADSLDTEEERQLLLKDLYVKLGLSFENLAKSRKLSLMNAEELKSVDESGCKVEFHTHRHRFPSEPEIAAIEEIAKNENVIEAAIGRKPSHFCYPSGDWEKRHWRYLESTGIKSATTCDVGWNSADTPKYALKRFLDRDDAHEIEFIAELYGFAEFLRRSVAILRRQ